MTNASVVGSPRPPPQGQLLKVTYKDGAAEVIVASRYADRHLCSRRPSLLKPGAAVTIFAQEEAGRELDDSPRDGGEGRRQAADVKALP